MKHNIACLVIVEADDARLDPDRLNEAAGNRVTNIAIQQAMQEALRSATTPRVLGIMSEEEANLMLSAHEFALKSTVAMCKDISPQQALEVVRRMIRKQETAVPGYWMNETTGVLRPAIETYLTGGAMTDEQIAAMRAYLRQWIAADWHQCPEIDKLREDIDGLVSRATIDDWLDRALDQAIDPL